MSIKIHWHNKDQTILCFIFAEEWDIFDWLGSVEAMHKLLDEKNYKVPGIILYKHQLKIPRGILNHLPEMSKGMDHPNGGGKLVIVGAKDFVRSVTSIFSTVYAPIEFADTVEEAEAILTENLIELGVVPPKLVHDE